MKHLSFDVDDETYRRLVAEYDELIEEFETNTREYPFSRYLEECMKTSVETDEELKHGEDEVMGIIEDSPTGATPRQIQESLEDTS